MKWGHAHEVNGAEKLLYVVLTWVLTLSDPLDRWIEEIVSDEGEMGGDPGWSIERISAADGSVHYKVWANPEISGIERDEEIYGQDVFNSALRELLMSYAERFPEKCKEACDLIERCGL
ncbi:hypothetical protein [Burkholderia ubonensis]|uniref:hypothetical protein n=1 Tax=Burkholderia ubonensis TaxID=101571 RepID=UPI0012F7EC04|nr:hypothetical protein [Burkholderia ubonensis]